MMAYIATLIIGLTVLFGGGLAINKGNINKTLKDIPFIKNLIKTPTPTETPLPTEKPTSFPTPTTDPDPIIDCKFTYLGTLQLRRSICAKSTDCQINGKWVYYDSVERCKQDQNSANSQNNSGNNNVNQNNSGSSQSSLIDCTANGKTFKASANDCMDLKNLNQTINDAKRDIDSQKYSECIAKPFSDFSACTGKCSGQRSYANDACLESYLGVHPLIENNQQKFDECAAEVGNIYTNCFNDCAKKKQDELNACK